MTTENQKDVFISPRQLPDHACCYSLFTNILAGVACINSRVHLLLVNLFIEMSH